MILTGKDVKEKQIEELKNRISNLDSSPKLAIVLIGENEASKIYVNNKLNLAKELGLETLLCKYDTNVTEEELINKINTLNNDNTVNGVIVQLPLPNHLNENNITSLIDSQKDVDAFTSKHVYDLVTGSNEYLPCTVEAIIDLLNHYNIDIASKNVVIAGRSNIVGKPLMQALLNLDASVSIIHSKTKNPKDYIKNADIFISAIGISRFYTKNYFEDNSDITIIDVGITKENNKTYGDVDFENVSKIVKNISPVPGGVGVLTVVNVIKNTVKSYESMKENNVN